jgi:hypothetical protein
MRHVLRAVAAFVMAFAFQAVQADESPAAAFFTKLAGHWQGNGEVRLMAADMRMHWEPVLDGQFHRLSMEDVMTGADGKSWHFKAQGYYRVQTDGTISGTWFDSRGISLPLTGRVEGDTMTIDWGTEAIERGRSSYRLGDGALEVTDEVYAKEGELRVFGRTRLTRPE